MKKSRQMSILLRRAVPAIVLVSSVAGAQQTLGSLNGTVTDASGAVIIGAKVMLTGDQNGIKQTATTKKNGTYQFQNLPVGVYALSFVQSGFETSRAPSIQVQADRTGTVNIALKAGSEGTTIEVNAQPLLNQTDATNGYVLDARTIQETPLATGSFTQLAIQAPGVSAELLSGIGTNNGLGNQPIWANGQRDTSNGFSVDGVDVTNLFNGKSSSASESGRLSLNIGGGGAIAGQQQTATSVYGSNGNALASPAPEFSQEITVNTSSYNADQGNHSGAQINVTTGSGSNQIHGQFYGHRATNAFNAAPYFNKQAAGPLATIGPANQSIFNPAANPALHRYTVGGTLSGPIIPNRLFIFGGYEFSRITDDNKGVSTLQVPYGLTDDRTQAGILNAITSYNFTSNSPANNGNVQSTTAGTTFNGNFDPIAMSLLQAKFPNGQYLIPSAQSTTQGQLNSNVFLKTVPVFRAQKATAGLDYNLNQRDRLAFKYYYQLAPVISPFSYANTGGYPASQDNGAQVGALSNTITFGSKINWEQRMGYSRQKANSTFRSILPNSNYGIGFPNSNGLPALTLGKFAYNNGGSVTIGPTGAFPNTGYFQNRWNPETNVIFSLGRHNISTGLTYSYTQLNIRNKRAGQGTLATQNFVTFVEGIVNSSSELVGATSRYYRAQDTGAFVQDQWRVLSNLTLTAGVRYDWNGGLSEKYGNLFNFDPSRFSVTDTTIIDTGFVVAGNNKFSPTPGVSNSTLTGRQWGIAPRFAFAYTPTQNQNKVVFNGAFGLNYDRGEYFSYLSQPAGGGFSGPFGVTNAPPLVNQVNGSGPLTLANPLGTATLPVSSLDPAQFKNQLITASQIRTQCDGRLVEAQAASCSVQPANFAAYARDNKLPYIINFSFNVQVELDPQTTFTVGYTGNRGRHLVLPVPFNEPGIATAGNPIHGETASYGYEVLNNAAPITYNLNGVNKQIYSPISSEPLNTFDGGNSDLRVPYVGYSSGATSYRAAGISAYDSLQAHVDHRLTHGLQIAASYTFGHSHDEQSANGLFFTGSNPNRLRDSYANSDFDRTHTFNAEYKFELPRLAREGSFAGRFTNGWQIVGTAQLQSGQSFSLYDFSGAVGSVYYGTSYNAVDPVLGIKDPAHPKSARTSNPGTQVVTSRSAATNNLTTGGPTITYLPTIDPSQVQINNLAPGQKGIPFSQPSEPQDIFETDFTQGQRNIFRQTPQRSANMSFQKNTAFTDRFHLIYTFDVFNITNTASFDIPTNSVGIGRSSIASGLSKTVNGQVTSNAGTQSANYASLYPAVTSSSTLGSIRNTIGQARQIEMSLKLSF